MLATELNIFKRRFFSLFEFNRKLMISKKDTNLNMNMYDNVGPCWFKKVRFT